jgi:SAM-dependent methyltransferase
VSYEEPYFADRGDPRREAMRLQEFDRIRKKTGLDRGTVVDIGCGLGEFLELFPAEHWQRYGVEVSEYATNIAKQRRIAFDLPEGEGWADLVVLRGSLQHLDRPIETLFRAYSWLRPGGWLVALATPNAGGPVYRLFQELPMLDPPNNFVIFSDKELRQSLLNLGYTNISFVYPYVDTPYAKPARDVARFLLRFGGFRRPYSFWRNTMECYAQR